MNILKFEESVREKTSSNGKMKNERPLGGQTTMGSLYPPLPYLHTVVCRYMHITYVYHYYIVVVVCTYSTTQ